MSKKKGPSLLSMIERERHRVAATITHQDPEWSQPQPNRSVAKMFVIMLAVHILVIAGLIIYDFASGGQKKVSKIPPVATAPSPGSSSTTPPVQAPPSSGVAAVDPRSETPSVNKAPAEPLPQPPVIAGSTPPLPVVSSPVVAAAKPAPSSGMPSLSPGSSTRVALPPATEPATGGGISLAMAPTPSTISQPKLKADVPPAPKKDGPAYQPPSPKDANVAAAKPENKPEPKAEPKVEPKKDKEKEKTIASAPAAKPAAKSSTSSKPATTAPAKLRSNTGVTRHTVRRGDTLGSIARRYGVSKEALARANKIRNPDQVMLDTKLVIPTR